MFLGGGRMTNRAKITAGPNAFDMAVNMFRPIECPELSFHFSGVATSASIESATSKGPSGTEWELVLYLPFSGECRLRVMYNCQTRQGEVVEIITEPDDDPLNSVSDRAMHRAFARRA
jgi:hypothetical protein